MYQKYKSNIYTEAKRIMKSQKQIQTDADGPEEDTDFDKEK